MSLTPLRLLVLSVAFSFATACVGQPAETTDIYRTARSFASESLKNVRLTRTSGNDVFDITGRRQGPIICNFVGQDTNDRWMIINFDMTTDGRVDFDPADNPREDRWGHHLKPDLELERWISLEEGALVAVKQHPDNPPRSGVSMASFWSTSENRFHLGYYWQIEQWIYFVDMDPRTGAVVKVGRVEFPDQLLKD